MIVGLFAFGLLLMAWAIRRTHPAAERLSIETYQKDEEQSDNKIAVQNNGVVSNKRFSVYDLPSDDRNRMLEGVTFERCELAGPAIVRLEGYKTTGIKMLGGRGPKDYIYTVEPGRVVVGAVGLRNCTYVDCVFDRVGFILTPEESESFLRLFKSD